MNRRLLFVGVAVALGCTSSTFAWAKDSDPRGFIGNVSFDTAHHAYVTTATIWSASTLVDKLLKDHTSPSGFLYVAFTGQTFSHISMPTHLAGSMKAFGLTGI